MNPHSVANEPAPPFAPKGNGGLETRVAVIESRLENYATREQALEYQTEIANKLTDMHKEIGTLWWKMGGVGIAIAGVIIAALKLLP